MVASSVSNESPASGRSRAPARIVGPLVAAAALLPAALLGAGSSHWSPNLALVYVIAHAVLFLAGLIFAGRFLRLPERLGGAGCTVAALLALLPAFAGTPRFVLIYLHVAAGTISVAWLLRATIRGASSDRKLRWLSALPILTALLLLSAYTFREWAWSTWQSPRYDSQACYRFLTATTAEQSGEPLFPSALRVQGKPGRGCQESGCHAQVHQRAGTHAHSTAGASLAYTRTLADFVQRRGVEAARWCRGCHSPEAAPEPITSSLPLPGKKRGGEFPTTARGLTCTSCHQVDAVHALYGSAALRLRGGPEPETHSWQVSLRPKAHAAQNVRPSLHRSAELCGACHRKNWNLPQNGFHWQPGPDEFGQWQTSRYASSLFAPGERVTARGCLSCHDAHSKSSTRSDYRTPALELSLFLRSGPAGRLVSRSDEAPQTRPGEPLLLDVVVRNAGIGHDFPTGMPDLQESWLEVTLVDRTGRVRLSSGQTEPGEPVSATAHVYRLIGRNQRQRPVLHGNLDEMTAVSEWRRIPAGAADVARFAFNAPPGGVGEVRVRLLRRRRPDFSRWAGEVVQREPEVLAQVGTKSARADVSSLTPPADEAGGWRHYGLALAGVKAYPAALQALNRALKANPADVETILALGRVYLEEGDLLAAQEKFRQAVSGDPERAQAWEAAVLRGIGQPDQAALLLEPLVRRYPRELRLRFELGSAYLAALRNADASQQFEAMLAIDPLNVSAHHNLMLSLLHLNRLTDARREETIYRLLRQEPNHASETANSLEDRPLHLHHLETRK